MALPLHHCEQRDTKGLYASAKAGAIDTLPGKGVPFEAPLAADITAQGGKDTAALREVVELVLARVALPTAVRRMRGG